VKLKQLCFEHLFRLSKFVGNVQENFLSCNNNLFPNLLLVILVFVDYFDIVVQTFLGDLC
jgi:hypothetical protein